MNLGTLLKFIPLVDPIMNRFSRRYRMHLELVNALENVLLVVNFPEDNAKRRREIDKAAKILAEAQGF